MVEQQGGATAVAVEPNEEFLSRIGHMTRALHESLRGLGLDKLIEKAASDIPDARDRLDYVARLSEDAAQKVLNATDAASPLQDRIAGDARQLSASWNGLLAAGAADQQWRALAALQSFLGGSDEQHFSFSACVRRLDGRSSASVAGAGAGAGNRAHGRDLE